MSKDKHSNLIILAAVAFILIFTVIITLQRKAPSKEKAFKNDIQELQEQSTSTDTESIEKDLLDTDLEDLDKELEDIEDELDAAY